MKFLENYRFENGIYIASSADKEFESLYLKVRDKEKRIYSDTEVSNLPIVSATNQHFDEWELRKITTDRFVSYLHNIGGNINLLDIGCGSGWFSANIAQNKSINICALDINRSELEQAARVFNYSNLNFINGNIFENIFDENHFKLITLNSSLQYFDDLVALVHRLFYFLKEGGEIHILDTPFYNSTELAGARRRTIEYYRSLGFLEMVKYYFHHSYEEIEKFNFSILFNPNSLMTRIKKLLNNKVSPFPWIKIVKQN
ncbi:MAG: methyltransferase domain-containing protein [Ignavibacteriaceae bacterium]